MPITDVHQCFDATSIIGRLYFYLMCNNNEKPLIGTSRCQQCRMTRTTNTKEQQNTLIMVDPLKENDTFSFFTTVQHRNLEFYQIHAYSLKKKTVFIRGETKQKKWMFVHLPKGLPHKKQPFFKNFLNALV